MTYQFIAEHQGTTPVKWMCSCLRGIREWLLRLEKALT
jgi:hypothetical protein